MKQLNMWSPMQMEEETLPESNTLCLRAACSFHQEEKPTVQ